MQHGDLRKYTVILEGGSGCIFQPLTIDYTYIITAKHLLYDEVKVGRGVKTKWVRKADGTFIQINRQEFDGNIWTEPSIPFKLKHGENYFEHDQADIAILKITPALKGFDQIAVEEDYLSKTGFQLCGYPMEIRNGLKYTTRIITNFIAPANYGESAQLDTQLNHSYIIGMSGGGILKEWIDSISIIGIQSRTASIGLSAGQVGFVPMKYANEIIGKPIYAGKLEPLLPPFFSSFEFLKDEIFKMKLGRGNKEKGEKLAKMLALKAKEIQDSQLTPKAIKDYLQTNLPTVYKQDAEELNLKKIWVLWLEILAVLNIAKKRKNCIGDLADIFKQVRIFYSDVDQDYWLTELDKLPWKDYHGLADGGLVVCASNIAATESHKLEFNAPDLAWVDKMEDEFDQKNYGVQTDQGTRFPMRRFNFVNISFFKEGSLPNLDDAFKKASPDNCFTLLKTLYDSLFPA